MEAVNGYVRGAAGTGDEATFAAATAPPPGAPRAPAGPHAHATAPAATSTPSSPAAAGATASAAGEALATAPHTTPLLPELTLSEVEAIADLARCAPVRSLSIRLPYIWLVPF